mmetsp:Transcript_10266/g.14509  ORF Transcript_10266/g.14509 Transcript_10266/m.14509 type:complete len:153 (-) Transcript_10266:141-599(-)
MQINWIVAFALFPVQLEAFAPQQHSLPIDVGTLKQMKPSSRRPALSFIHHDDHATPRTMTTVPMTLYARMQQKPGGDKISSKRRKQLGIADDEDEYDLGYALEQNTDDLISKIVAGSFILVIIALLVVGVVVPSLTDYGEGVCNPIQNAGRC